MHKKNPIKRKYVPHLPSLLAMGEHNYGKLMMLLPEVDEVNFEYEFSINEALTHRIAIKDAARYTTTIDIAQVAKIFQNFYYHLLRFGYIMMLAVQKCWLRKILGGLKKLRLP